MAGSSPNTRHLPKQARGGFPKEPPSTSSKITSAVRSRVGWPRSLEAESRVQQLLSLLVASPASPHLLPILVRSRRVKYIYSSFSFSAASASPLQFFSSLSRQSLSLILPVRARAAASAERRAAAEALLLHLLHLCLLLVLPPEAVLPRRWHVLCPDARRGDNGTSAPPDDPLPCSPHGWERRPPH